MATDHRLMTELPGKGAWVISARMADGYRPPSGSVDPNATVADPPHGMCWYPGTPAPRPPRYAATQAGPTTTVAAGCGWRPAPLDGPEPTRAERAALHARRLAAARHITAATATVIAATSAPPRLPVPRRPWLRRLFRSRK